MKQLETNITQKVSFNMRKRKYQIRTNGKHFGEVFGVYIIDEEKFVKQTSYSHGTFEMEFVHARKLERKLQENARNCWVKLYRMT